MEEWEEEYYCHCVDTCFCLLYIPYLRLIREIHVILSMVCSIYVYAKILVK